MNAKIEKLNLYRAIAELAYAMTMADGVFEAEEKEAFDEVIKEELGNENWVAELRFELVSSKKTSIEDSYKTALNLIIRNKNSLTESLIQKFKNIIKRIAVVSGISPEEEILLRRFDKDIAEIYQTKK